MAAVNIKWDEYCLQCQAKHGGTCPDARCASINYDPWGDPFPSYVYHMDGNSIAEYIAEKAKTKNTKETNNEKH